MTIIDTTTVSVLLVLVAVAVLAGIATIGFALARVYVTWYAGPRPASVPADTTYSFMHFRYGH